MSRKSPVLSKVLTSAGALGEICAAMCVSMADVTPLITQLTFAVAFHRFSMFSQLHPYRGHSQEKEKKIFLGVFLKGKPFLLFYNLLFSR